MAICDIVQYERAFPLELKHPRTKQPIGVTFFVKHNDCQAATDVVDGQSTAGITGAGPSSGSDTQLEVFAACVDSWDWGDQEFEEGKGVLDHTPENVLMVMKKAPWIAKAVIQATSNIANFTSD